VGTAPNLESIRNRIWFSLRLGKNNEREMQDDWNAHGEATFEFEVLETLKDDVAELSVKDLLKEKGLQWVERLGAGQKLLAP
jgi:hypothetical protein